MRLLCLTVGAALLGGCFSLDRDGDGFIDSPPYLGSENDEIACYDGVDNDLDGRIDCGDSDCLAGGFCPQRIPNTEPVGYENDAETCSNGIDDDNDGQFDCGDRDCQAILELCCVSEVDNASCSDRIDNDGNGFADCADFACRNGKFVTVCERETICDDGRDNDGDRFVDCGDEDCFCTQVCNPACPGAENTLARCQDGLDNDGNGFVDCGDFGCSQSDDPAVRALCEGVNEDTVERCTDGEDNDNDGFTDCADFSCQDLPDLCQDESTIAACTDGEDNNGNGFFDCEDFSCSDPAMGNPEADALRTLCESDFDSCRDGLDNEGDGFVDCADFSCQGVDADQACVRFDIDPSAPVRFARSTDGRTMTFGADQNPNCGLSPDCGDGGADCRAVWRRPCVESIVTREEFEEELADRLPDRTNVPPVLGDAIALLRAELSGQALQQAEEDLARLVARAQDACTDGFDNDGDQGREQFRDCSDWDCNWNPLVVDLDAAGLPTAAGQPLCRLPTSNRRPVCP